MLLEDFCILFVWSSMKEDVLDHVRRALVATLYCYCHPLEDLGAQLVFLCMRILVLVTLRVNDSWKDWDLHSLLARLLVEMLYHMLECALSLVLVVCLSCLL